MIRILMRVFLRWLASYSEEAKLARVAQRHELEQQIHATHD